MTPRCSNQSSMSVLLALLPLLLLVPTRSAPPPVSAVAPVKPTSAPRPASSAASGARTSEKVTVNAAPGPASSTASASTGNVRTLDPKKPPTVQCPVTEQRNLTAVSGQTLTLPCRAPANASIVAVMWTRRDLKAQHVLLVQNGKAVLEDQEPRFRSRVTLKDQLLRSGDLTLVLKDARPGDAGTYECRYKERRGMMTITSEPVSTVSLTVPLTGDGDDAKRQHLVRTVSLSVAGFALVFTVFVAVAVATCRRRRR